MLTFSNYKCGPNTVHQDETKRSCPVKQRQQQKKKTHTQNDSLHANPKDRDF